MTYFIELSDKRNEALFNMLKERFNAAPFDFAALPSASEGTLILSPAKKLTEGEANAIPVGMKIVAGGQTEAVTHALARRSIEYLNMAADETYIIKNAKLTAESTLHLVIGCTGKSIFENNILLLGGGRLAKASAILFSRLGLRVSIATFNKTEYETGSLYADKTYYGDAFKHDLADYDIIINTIPKEILDESLLCRIAAGTVLIELASTPCLDKRTVGGYPFKYVPAPGLPAVYCPESAARLMLEYICAHT